MSSSLSRTGSHQLSNGLMVSGWPEQQPKDRPPTMGSCAVPYTGGDVKKSGELGRMYGVDISSGEDQHFAPPKLPSRHNTGSARSGPHSGPKGLGSGSFNKKSSSTSFSGPMTPIQPTGLITSGPQVSSNSNRKSGQLDSTPVQGSFKKTVYGSAVTSLAEEVKVGFKVSRVAMWMFLVVIVMGLVVGAFLMAAVKKSVVLVVVGVVLIVAVMLSVWNHAYRRKGVSWFLKRYANAELRGAVDGQYVKVTGVVTCGSIPLETSYQKIPRCVFASSELYEYRNYGRRSPNSKRHFFSWECLHSERFVADFYISDFQSGLRALVKAGYGTKVAAFVKSTIVVDVNKHKTQSSPNFQQWLSERGFSSDESVLQLKEGFIKEGSTVSVMGVVRRQDNMLMIVSPSEAVSTGCRWPFCLLPSYIEGLILMCDGSQDGDAIPV